VPLANQEVVFDAQHTQHGGTGASRQAGGRAGWLGRGLFRSPFAVVSTGPTGVVDEQQVADARLGGAKARGVRFYGDPLSGRSTGRRACEERRGRDRRAGCRTQQLAAAAGVRRARPLLLG
jgi:hypothetical protein